MPVERRDAGRWMRDGKIDAKQLGDRVRLAETRADETGRRSPRPLGVDRSEGLDKSHVDSTRSGCERRQMTSLPGRGCSAWKPPMPWLFNPLEGKTINRRAGCGRTARPVRRGGSRGTQPGFLTPILLEALGSLAVQASIGPCRLRNSGEFRYGQVNNPG